jgi:cell division protein ZapE
MRDSVRQQYEAMISAGALTPDHHQRALAGQLDQLLHALGRRPKALKKSALGWLLARGTKREHQKGLYIYGGVGRGKTLLMDLFFKVVPTSVAKRRTHFHAFMAEVHDRIAAFRRQLKRGEARGDDPIPPVADAVASETGLLCFDEFSVDDIADAMILGRLFEQLFRRGVVVVATSNVPPDELYKGGLNRSLFEPFIALLKEHMSVFRLEAPRDFRLDISGSERRYATPLGPEADACLDAHFRHLTGRDSGEARGLANRGRTIEVPEASGNVARFTFEGLCRKPLGAADYLRIAETFGTIILSGVPVLDTSRRNEARRLINLIDALYDNRVRLIVSADAEPGRLWRGEDGSVESLQFARTASRLIEMRSDAYWNAAAQVHAEMKKARAVRSGP